MTSSNVHLDIDEIRDLTYRFVGRFFIAFAGMELNLSLQVGSAGTFHEKLERYYELAIAQCADRDMDFCEISAWYMAADSIRELRNLFAHGRWAFLPQTQSVVHVKGYPPDPQDERRFAFAELDSIASDAELLGVEMLKLSARVCTAVK